MRQDNYTKRSILSHLQTVRSMEIPYSSKKPKPPKPYLKPDPNDPNWHFAPCVRTFKTRNGFRYHLKHNYQLTIPSIPRPGKRSIRHPHLTPDIDDPNFSARLVKRLWLTRLAVEVI